MWILHAMNHPALELSSLFSPFLSFLRAKQMSNAQPHKAGYLLHLAAIKCPIMQIILMTYGAKLSKLSLGNDFFVQFYALGGQVTENVTVRILSYLLKVFV